MKISKLILSVMMIALVTPTMEAKTWYVDANGGSDGWDGSSSNHVSGTIVGPKLTLCGALTNATRGDFVYALPGRYNKGTYGVARKYRAYISNVTVISTDGPEVTFIEGEPDPDVAQDSYPFGCGPKAVSGVVMVYGGTIQGFTFCNCRVADSSSHNGGAIVGDRLCAGSAIDCIFTNNIAYRGGAIYNLDYAVRCRFHANRALDSTGASAVDGLCYMNCFFGSDNRGDNQVYSTRTDPAPVFLGCTAVSSGSMGAFLSWTDRAITVANSVLVGPDVGGCTYYDTFLAAESVNARSSTNGNCRIVTASDLQFTADGYPVKGQNVAIDAGFYDKYAELVPARLADQTGTALGGTPRISNGHVDAGAAEYDWRVDYATDLSPLNVAVLSVSSNVYENADRMVAIPDGQELVVRIDLPDGTEDGLPCRFQATVSGQGTLKVYCNDGESAAYSLTSGMHDQAFVATPGMRLRFAMEGDGEAILAKMSICTTVEISDEGDDLVFSGIVSSPAAVVGEPVTLTVSRKGVSEKLLRGIKVNGKFHAFDSEGVCQAWTRVLSPGDESLKIEAVYDEVKTWYADAVWGNDGNNGYSPSSAKKTLVAATGIASPRQRVCAMPGRYTEGTYDVNGRLYRARVSNIVLFSAEGSERTFIEGALDPDVEQESSPYGCGPKAVSGIHMLYGGTIQGFTFRNCRVKDASANLGAAVVGDRSCAGKVIDCVFTDNVAYRGGAIYNVDYAIRCRFLSNKAAGATGACAVDGLYYINCFFGNNNAGNNQVYSTRNDPAPKFIGCTAYAGAQVPFRSWTPNALTIVNSVLIGPDDGGCSYYDSFLTASTIGANSSTNGKCRLVAAADLQFTSDGRPVGEHNVAIDAGFYDMYASQFPAEVSDHVNISLGGGQRIYNGCIDAGAFEYDWRPEFSKCLHERRVFVEEATPNVSIASASSLYLSDGDVLDVAWMVRTPGKCQFKTSVSEQGKLSVYVNDVPAMPTVDGVYVFVLGKGKSTVRAKFSGEGVATVGDFVGAEAGMVIGFR